VGALMLAAIVLVQVLLMVALAPLWNGVVGAIKARLQMRHGPPVLQRYRDLFKLASKETVLSEHASPLARVAPYLVLGAAVTLCTWTPVLTTQPGLAFAGDLVMTVALLAAMRVLLALLALEAGTTFGGMAASRHLALSALAEPALMLAVFTLALNAKSTDLATIASAVEATPHAWISPSHLLALTAVWIVVVSETGRVPVDNPVTHLELTMIHEGLVLDVSGHHLALLEWAAAVRQMVLLTLVANLFLPWGISATLSPEALGIALLAWLGKLLVFAVVVALTESLTSKMRLFRVPEFLGMAFLLALIALTSDTLTRG
jgi:formate hydrogenlyase subunit 4